MTTEKELWEKIDQAIHDMIKPPVLTSPRWLRHYPDGKPADFQFFGTLKVAKATGKDVHRIAGMLLKRLDLAKLGLSSEVQPDGVINFRKQAKGAKARAAEKGKTEADAADSEKERPAS